MAGQQKSAPPAKLSYSWASLALWGWGACGSLFVFLTLLAWRRLRDHLAGRKRITEGPLLEELQVLRAKAKIRRPVRLSTCEKLSAPIATGVLFPQICLPTRSVQELDRDEGRAMLAHELAHIARLDPLWLSVGQAVQTLFFFQPLNRLARRRIDFSAEMLCDAQAVEWTGERVALARCLTKVAGWVMADRQDLPVCAMAKLRSPLAARVQGILQADERLRGGGHWALPSTAAIVVGTWMMVPGFASPQITPVMPSATSLLAASPPRGEVPLAAMGREDAPTEWPIHRVPPSEETRVASPSAVRTGAVQADALSVLLAGQNADMGALELEIAELRERMQANGTSDKAWKRLLEIEHRVSRVRALGSRVHDILNLLTTPRVPTSDAQFTPQLGDDR